MSTTDWLQWLDDADDRRPLFIDGERQLTAAGLRARADALAASLRARGIGAGDAVAVHLPRGLDAVIAIYGILRAGACYVPLPPGYPAERNRFIVDDAGCRCIISDGPPDWLADSPIDHLDIHNPGPADITLDAPATDPEQAAAILYTSGSTGLPKGVVLSRRTIAAFCAWAADCFQLDAQDRVANLAPFNFDLSLFDLFAAPQAGASTCFIPDALTLSPARLVDWLRDQAITTWYTVPSMLGLIGLKGGLGTQGLPQLRRLLFAGEVFPTVGLKRLAALLSTTRLYNLFGPTETNVCLYWPVERARLDRTEPIPIGLPAANAELRIDPERSEL
jgi:non-ribosomal peptide synthetase component F